MKKINAAGFSHIPVVMAFLVVFAIAGVGYLVATHAATYTAAPGAVPDITWYVSNSTADQEISLLHQAGVKWVRLELDWSGLENGGKGVYNADYFGKNDYAISKAQAAGIQLQIEVNHTPYWASADPAKYIDSSGVKHWNNNYKPANMQDYADFMTYVVNRYKSYGAHDYEVWNEPNLPQFWPSGVNAADYLSMLKITYPAVKAADSQSQVLLAGLSQGNNVSGSTDYYTYLQQLYSAGARPYFDIAAIHVYTDDPTYCPADSSGTPLVSTFCSIGQIHNIMTANSDGTKDIWLTEMGAGSTCGTASYCVSESQQATNVTNDFSKLTNYPYVKVAMLYNVRNLYWTASTDTTWDANLGLTHQDFTLKPAYTAYQTYAQNWAASTTTTTTTTPPPPAPNAPPAVTITSPANSSTFSNYLDVKATATDSDDAIAKVEFYFDGSLKATSYTAPYEYIRTNFKHVSYTAHTITVKAYDSQGATSSASITVTRV